jgi:hypothetical protein
MNICDANDLASENYPAVDVFGHRLHVFFDGDWNVWLNTEASDFDGLCIGVGATRSAAIAQAVRALEAVVEVLQGPTLDDIKKQPAAADAPEAQP